MTEIKEIIIKAREWALEEIKRTGYPSVYNFETSNLKGQELAEKLGADKEIIMLGTILMDVKLGECLGEGKLSEHAVRSAEAGKIFLENNEVERGQIEIIVNCIAAHHKKVPYKSLEAEICANADCYRFLLPQNIFHSFLGYAQENGMKDALEHIEEKMEEKWNILSLNICKNELESVYFEFKKLIAGVKKNIRTM